MKRNNELFLIVKSFSSKMIGEETRIKVFSRISAERMKVFYFSNSQNDIFKT